MNAPTMVAAVMCFASLTACADDPDSELGKKQQAETIEVRGCRPGTIGNGEICVDPLEGGGGGASGGSTGGDGSPGGPGGSGGGETVPEVRMDPEPDRQKDLKSCWEWCQWNRRQCEKECWHKFPAPFGDWHKRSMCIQDICEDHINPNIGRKACQADCNDRWRDRP
jgi:hypothetical protein